MAIYRNVQMSFWTDRKVNEDFTPEDRYFYLYLFTNPHTNLTGCYELGIKQAANETGYNTATIERLIDRFKNVHKIVDYDKDTSEILLVNWHKYNWTKSNKFLDGLNKQIECVKSKRFKTYLNKILEGIDTVYIPYTYGMDTSVTDTVTDTDTVSNTNTDKEKTKKHKYGDYDNVLLTDDEYNKLSKEYVNADELIRYLDEYIEMKGYKAKSHYLAIKKWVVDAVKEHTPKSKRVDALPKYEMDLDNL